MIYYIVLRLSMPCGFNFAFKCIQEFADEKNVTNKSPLKGLSHEIDFKNVDENGQNLALARAAAGF